MLLIGIDSAGDVNQIKEYKPVDVTTNPSLVLAAIDVPSYEPIIRKALQDEADAGVVDTVNPYAGELLHACSFADLWSFWSFILLPIAGM